MPLGYCFFLVQDNATYLNRLRPAEAAARLMSNLWCINNLGDLAANALKICCDIEQIPCYELHFELNERFWEQISGCPRLRVNFRRGSLMDKPVYAYIVEQYKLHTNPWQQCLKLLMDAI